MKELLSVNLNSDISHDTYDIKSIEFVDGINLKCGAIDPQLYLGLPYQLEKPTGIPLCEITYTNTATGTLQVFWDYGEGLSEVNSTKRDIEPSNKILIIRLPIKNWQDGTKLVALRIDPPNGSEFILEGIRILKGDLRVTILYNFTKILKEKLKREKYSTKIDIEKYHKKYQIALIRLNRKIEENRKIRVVFFARGSSMDSFSELYQEFKSCTLFDPIIVVLPSYYDNNKGRMIEKMNEAGKYLSELGMEYINGYDQSKDKFLNVYKSISPDIVFFDNPYDWNHPFFSIESFPPQRVLSFFIPYGYSLANNVEHHFIQKMRKLVYLVFAQTQLHIALFNKNPLTNGANICQSFLGYPKVTRLINSHNDMVKDKWRIKNRNIKRIIWAPHHILAGYSNFLEYKDFMLNLPELFHYQIQVAFKPHPGLDQSLMKIANWTKQEVDAYYAQWESMPNTQLETGSWIDLFLTSDAMILDSISFMAEYSLTGKPACVITRMDNEKRVMKFNETGEELFEKLYHASNKFEITNFVEEVVFNGNDYKKKERDLYIKENYIGKGSEHAAHNILNYIIDDIKGKEVQKI